MGLTLLKERDSYSDVKYLALKAIVKAIADTSSRIMMTGLNRALKNVKILAHINKGIMAYLYAAGFLSFAGREISKENMSKIIESIGLRPSDELMQTLLDADIKSHLVYVYAFYFLLANGFEATEAEIANVIRALGMEPDARRVRDILEFVKIPF